MPYIGTSPSNGVRRVHTYTATASQTTFTGASSEGVTLSYVDTNYLDVFQNGVLLGSADYTSTSGTSVVLAQGASADDLIVIVVYDVFSVADTVSKANGGSFDSAVTMSNNLTVSGAFTSQGIDDNADATAITIDSSERVGIGTTSPDVALEISKSSGDATLKFTRSDTASTNNNFGNILFENSVGTTLASIRGYSGSGNTEAGMNFSVGANATEAMRVDNNGALLISRTDQTVNSSNFGSALSSGNINTAKNTNGSGVVVQVYGNAGKAFIYGDGDIGNDNGTYSSFSDQSLKENIVDAKSQWADIKAVQVRNFNLIASPDLTQIGVVAQELEASDMGGLVEEKEHDNEGNKKKTVKLSVLHMKALKALQEAMARIETLEAKVTALENAE